MANDECEMRGTSGWERVSVDDALHRKDDQMRCVECEGEVRPFRSYSTGTRAHFEHRVRHAGCSTKPRSFSGRKSRHPLALS